MSRRRALVLMCLVLEACASDPEPIERPTDPRTCPALAPTVGDACGMQGQACHYTGGACGPNVVCNDGRWEDTGGRFSCGDCASDVRCDAGATCESGDATCACGSDGVFACSRDGGPTSGFPACPIEQPPSSGCSANGQLCHYFAGTCATECECASGTWSCAEACGA